MEPLLELLLELLEEVEEELLDELARADAAGADTPYLSLETEALLVLFVDRQSKFSEVRTD